jgi:hypothetical protein
MKLLRLRQKETLEANSMILDGGKMAIVSGQFFGLCKQQREPRRIVCSQRFPNGDLMDAHQMGEIPMGAIDKLPQRLGNGTHGGDGSDRTSVVWIEMPRNKAKSTRAQTLFYQWDTVSSDSHSRGDLENAKE